MPSSCLVGLGLIGGSVALALRARGYDREERALARARERGIDAAESLAEAVRGAEVVVIAVSTEQTPAVLREAARAAPNALLTDVASLKRTVAASAGSLPAGTRFVAGHPMAGSKTPGIEGARADLFEGRAWLVVPTERSDLPAIESVQKLVSGVGAHPVVVEPDRHDRLMTWVSHLPHAVAAALARAVAAGAGEEIERFAGPGLLDTTRIAGTPGDLALELALGDPEALARAIDDVRAELDDFAASLRSGERKSLRARFEAAAAARRVFEKP